MNTIDKSIYNDFVPLPYDADGWGGDSEIFKELIEKTNPNLIIEVGTWKGQSAINMGRTIKSIGSSCKILCVDTWLGALEFWGDLKHTTQRDLHLKHGYPQIYYQFLSNIIHENLQDIILPFPNTSSIASKHFLKEKIKADLIYIDASHEEDDVYSDINNYYKILTNTGIIFGDDWNLWPGVTNAVKRFIKENKVNFSTKDRFWIIER